MLPLKSIPDGLFEEIDKADVVLYALTKQYGNSIDETETLIRPLIKLINAQDKRAGGMYAPTPQIIKSAFGLPKEKIIKLTDAVADYMEQFDVKRSI